MYVVTLRMLKEAHTLTVSLHPDILSIRSFDLTKPVLMMLGLKGFRKKNADQKAFSESSVRAGREAVGFMSSPTVYYKSLWRTPIFSSGRFPPDMMISNI